MLITLAAAVRMLRSLVVIAAAAAVLLAVVTLFIKVALLFMVAAELIVALAVTVKLLILLAMVALLPAAVAAFRASARKSGVRAVVKAALLVTVGAVFRVPSAFTPALNTALSKLGSVMLALAF